MKWPWKRRCSQCRREVPENKNLRDVKFADGAWRKVCPNCYSIMGRPNQRANQNKMRQSQPRKPRQRSTGNPNQLKLF